MEAIALNPDWRRALRAWERYPLVFAAGVIGTVAALYLNHLPRTALAARATSGNLVMAAWLGVPLLFALAERSRQHRHPFARAVAWQAGGAALLVVYHRLAAEAPWNVRITRFWLCLAAAHLLVVLGGSVGRGASHADFWRYNRRLALRLAPALGHGALLFLGLALGMAALKSLFELGFPDAWYLDPAILALGLAANWTFLAASPGEGREPAYPARLRLPVRLVFVPLVCAYLCIVYAYGVRVIMQGIRPDGWVAWMLLGLCALALLCLFLAQPLAEAGGDRWLGLYCRHFHVAMAPVVLILCGSIAVRVRAYGLTENRYLACVAAAWMAGILLHAALGAPRDLRLVPASLGLVALLAGFGPWGAFEVSWRSQADRLRGLLEENGMLTDGRLGRAPGRLPRLAVREIGGAAAWLEERGRLGDLEKWLIIDRETGTGASNPSESPAPSDASGMPGAAGSPGASAGPRGTAESSEAFPMAATAGAGESTGVPASAEADGPKAMAASLTAYGPEGSGAASAADRGLGSGAFADRYSFLEALGLPYLPPQAAAPGNVEAVAFHCSGLATPWRTVSGFDWFLSDFRAGSEAASPDASSEGRMFAFEPETGTLRFLGGDSAGPVLELGAHFDRLRRRYADAYDLNLPAEEMRVEAENGRYKVVADLRSISGELQSPGAPGSVSGGAGWRLRGVAADLFVEVKGGVRPRGRSAFHAYPPGS